MTAVINAKDTAYKKDHNYIDKHPTKPNQHLKVKPKSMQQDDDILGC